MMKCAKGIQSGLSWHKNTLCPITPSCQVHSEKDPQDLLQAQTRHPNVQLAVFKKEVF
jgi:quinolinate synthase